MGRWDGGICSLCSSARAGIIFFNPVQNSRIDPLLILIIPFYFFIINQLTK